MVASGAVTLICVVALFKPLPQLRLGNRIFTAALLLMAALPIFASSFIPQPDLEELKATNPTRYFERLQRTDTEAFESELAALKASDADAYFEQLQALDAERYLKELEQLRPEEHAALMAEFRERQRQEQEAERKRQAQIAEQDQQQEVDEAARLTAETEAEKERQSRFASKITGMADGISLAIQKHYGVQPSHYIPDQPICRDGRYCEMLVEPFRITIFGAGIAKVDPSIDATRVDYMELCGVVFAGISGADPSFAAETVGLVYAAALQQGSHKTDVAGVEVKVTQGLSDQLECQFFKI